MDRNVHFFIFFTIKGHEHNFLVIPWLSLLCFFSFFMKFKVNLNHSTVLMVLYFIIQLQNYVFDECFKLFTTEGGEGEEEGGCSLVTPSWSCELIFQFHTLMKANGLVRLGPQRRHNGMSDTSRLQFLRLDYYHKQRWLPFSIHMDIL